MCVCMCERGVLSTLAAAAIADMCACVYVYVRV